MTLRKSAGARRVQKRRIEFVQFVRRQRIEIERRLYLPEPLSRLRCLDQGIGVAGENIGMVGAELLGLAEKADAFLVLPLIQLDHAELAIAGGERRIGRDRVIGMPFGQRRIRPELWPDPAAMNKELKICNGL